MEHPRDRARRRRSTLPSTNVQGVTYGAAPQPPRAGTPHRPSRRSRHLGAGSASSHPASVSGRSRRRANGAQEIVHPTFMPLVGCGSPDASWREHALSAPPPSLPHRRFPVPGRSVFRRSRTALTCALTLTAAAAVGLWTGIGGSSSAQAAAGVPTPDHVIVVVFENHGYSQVIGSSSAPYILAEERRRQPERLVRRDTPQSAQLLRPVLRLHAGHHGRQLLHPRLLQQAQPRVRADRRGQDLGELQRDASQPGFDHVQQRQLRPQAQPVVRLQQRPDLIRVHVPAVPHRLHETAAGLLRRPEPVQRHARLLGLDR